MSKQASGLRFTLSVGKLPADAFVVVGFTLHEQFSSPLALELEVASAKPSVEFRSILDNTATLTIWRETEVQRVVNGIVTSMMPDFIKRVTGLASVPRSGEPGWVTVHVFSSNKTFWKSWKPC
ncbi:contractile injection system protein, VgrG/Pvc8 family [Serratia fonticola]|uniref:contractile injection system protein, VgrG/Pvc8 family n=1 Tax=Serratia fonticola TaxID=47917 RepID=UPI001FD78791|nr:contractile injection system protein, VgrG/Pvc8 family [Serratia fonticola]